MKTKLYILGLFLLTACSTPVTEESAVVTSDNSNELIVLSSAQLAQTNIVIDTLQRRLLSGSILLQGKVEAPPQNLVSVSVPLGGYLKSTDLLPGAKIVKGQKLAVLEDPAYIQLQQDYLMGKIKLKQLESEFLRQNELMEGKAISEKSFKQTESEFLAQKVQVKALAEKLALIGICSETLTDDNLSRSLVLNSPITGFVAQVNANIGKYLSPGEILFELVDVSDIHLSLRVFERDLQRISVGQKISAYTSHSPDKKYPGEIIAYGHSLDEDKSTVVHCHFDSYNPELVLGMFMSAEISLKPNTVTCLPDEAIIHSGVLHYLVEAISDSTFRFVQVEEGIRQNGFTEIISDKDLSNKRWVVRGANWIRMKRENVEEE